MSRFDFTVNKIITHPETIPALITSFLEGSTTGTLEVSLRRIPKVAFKHIGPDAKRRNRIADWIKERWDNNGDFTNTEELLLDFEHFLREREVERQRA
jgi:hypothetical protein